MVKATGAQNFSKDFLEKGARTFAVDGRDPGVDKIDYDGPVHHSRQQDAEEHLGPATMTSSGLGPLAVGGVGAVILLFMLVLIAIGVFYQYRRYKKINRR